MGRRGFLEEAGKATEGVIFPLLHIPHKDSAGFEKKFTSRFGYRPDYLAAHTYDTVNLLIGAIRKAGLNRARIRDAVRELSPWAGVTGIIKWDTLGGNSRTVQLGTVKAGRVISVSEPLGPDEATHRFSQQ
jgi:branched-chain amino acid transport system substrate-binding protein